MSNSVGALSWSLPGRSPALGALHPIERDGSNDTEVASHLRDDPYLQDLVDRTHARIVLDPVLRFKTYVSAIHSVFDDLSKQRASAKPALPFKNVRKPITFRGRKCRQTSRGLTPLVGTAATVGTIETSTSHFRSAY